LEPVSGYLLLAEKAQPGGWNFGPDENGAVTVGRLSDLIVKSWGGSAEWKEVGDPNAPHEEAYLKLDCSKARQLLGWRPRITVSEAVDWTVEWYKRALSDSAKEMFKYTIEQISRYERIDADPLTR
jgi:CDP-glucose 4,6-dehydratase